MIRVAGVPDVDAIVAMAGPFLNYSHFTEYTEIERDDIVFGICNLIDNGIIFVAEKEDEIVGCICGMITNLWFARNTKVAAELGWWVNEEHRGSTASMRLLQAFENWAKEQGVKAITMSDLVIDGQTPTGQIYKKLGYELVERAHVKGV
jgi:GNAT superfamily N-acetyltransferase